MVNNLLYYSFAPSSRRCNKEGVDSWAKKAEIGELLINVGSIFSK